MGYMNSLQTIDGKVIDKYRIQNGNICLIIEDENNKRYSVKLEDYTSEPCFSNLYGRLSSKFQNMSDNFDHLIEKDNYVGVKIHHSENPIRIGYRLNYVSNKQLKKVSNLNPSFGKNYNAYFGNLRLLKVKARNQFLQRNFFLENALSQTDVWRAKSEGKRLVFGYGFNFETNPPSSPF